MGRIIGWLAAAALLIAALAYTAAHESGPSPSSPLVRPSHVQTSWPAQTSRPSNVKTIGPGYRAPASCKDTDRKNIPYGDPDYAPWLDVDGDGLACEVPRSR